MPTMNEIEKDLYASKHDIDVRPGDTVKVHVRIREGEKSRVQIFEGTMIGLHRGGPRTTLTVRKTSYGVGVERIFPLHTNLVDKIEVTTRYKVRRAKLYYLRNLTGKKARLQPIRGWRANASHSA